MFTIQKTSRLAKLCTGMFIIRIRVAIYPIFVKKKDFVFYVYIAHVIGFTFYESLHDLQL